MSKDSSGYEASAHTHVCKACHQTFDCEDDICYYLMLPLCPFCAVSNDTKTVTR